MMILIEDLATVSRAMSGRRNKRKIGEDDKTGATSCKE